MILFLQSYFECKTIRHKEPEITRQNVDVPLGLRGSSFMLNAAIKIECPLNAKCWKWANWQVNTKFLRTRGYPVINRQSDKQFNRQIARSKTQGSDMKFQFLPH
jgi:hypothetical protein